MKKVSHSGDYAKFEKDSITTKHIVYLSAAADHEFVLLRGKHENIIFHRVKGHCRVEGELFDLLVAHKLQFLLRIPINMIIQAQLEFGSGQTPVIINHSICTGGFRPKH